MVGGETVDNVGISQRAPYIIPRIPYFVLSTPYIIPSLPYIIPSKPYFTPKIACNLMIPNVNFHLKLI